MAHFLLSYFLIQTAAGISKEGNGRQRDLEKKIEPADSSTLRFVQMAESLEVMLPLAEHSEILTQGKGKTKWRRVCQSRCHGTPDSRLHEPGRF